MFSEPAKDILSALQTDGKIGIWLLDLLLRIDGWAVVGYGTTHDYDIAVSTAISDGIKHILGALNIHFLNACERLDAIDWSWLSMDGCMTKSPLAGSKKRAATLRIVENRA